MDELAPDVNGKISLVLARRDLTSVRTTSSVEQVFRFARHFDRAPDTWGPEEIRAYQVRVELTRATRWIKVERPKMPRSQAGA